MKQQIETQLEYEIDVINGSFEEASSERND